jgi:hypothetical protein
MSSDPFLTAWSPLQPGRQPPPRAYQLAPLSAALMEWDPVLSLRVARALSHAQAFRQVAGEDMQLIVQSLRGPALKKAMGAFLRARKGPMLWRQFWARQAMGQGRAVAAERQRWGLSQAQLEAWTQASKAMAEACASVLEKANAASPPVGGQHWEGMLAQLALAQVGLLQLQSQLEDLLRILRSNAAVAGVYQQASELVSQQQNKVGYQALEQLLRNNYGSG